MRRLALVLAISCGCGPVQGEAGDAGSGSTTQLESASTPVSITENSTVPPQSEASSLEVGSHDAVSFEEGPFEAEGVKLDMYVDPCEQTYVAYPATSAVFVLIDASQTMVTSLLDHDGDPDTPEITRWSFASGAVVERMPDLVERGLVSIASFPSFAADAPPSAAACTIDPLHPPLGSTVDALVQYLPLPDATFMQGATPTAAAIAGAHAELLALGDVGTRDIVVITDGAPNCSAELAAPELFDQLDTDAYEHAATAHDGGMQVHVIGIDVPSGVAGGGPEGDAIVDHRAMLSELAQQGGTSAIFADDATVLGLALDTIVEAAASCRLVVPAEAQGQWYYVIIGGQYFYEVAPESCHDSHGWARVAFDDVEVVELCGSACELLHWYGSAAFELQCVIPE